MKYKLIPAIIAKDTKELKSRLKKVRILSKTIHFDVMDGHFVDSKSLMFDFDIKPNYEFHLMLQDPLAWIESHPEAQNVLIHMESSNVPAAISSLKKQRKKIGLVLNPETNISKINRYIKDVDKIVIMSVHPGKYGSSFVLNSLVKIKELREKYKIDIEVDGGVNLDTITLCQAAGANHFVMGSYLQNAKSPKKAFQKIMKVIQ